MGDRAAVIVTLLVVWVSSLPAAWSAPPPAQGGVSLVWAPEATVVGDALAVVVRVTGAAFASVELKVTLQTQEKRAVARAWANGTWVSGDRYATRVTLDEDGSWTGLVPLAVSPDARPGFATLLARARADGRTRDATRAIEVRAGDSMARAAWGVAPEGAAWVGAWVDDRLASASPVGFAGSSWPVFVPGAFSLAVLEPAQLRFMDARGLEVDGTAFVGEAASLRLRELAPRTAARDAEYVTLENVDPRSEVPLVGVCLRVEGASPACFSQGRVAPGGTWTVARNASAFARDHGHAPDGEFGHLLGGAFSLPDARGRVVVEVASTVVTEVAYETPGVNARLLDRPAARVGQTRLVPESFPVNGSWQPFVTPDAGARVAATFFGNARHAIDLAGYTLKSEEVAAFLAGAAARGVRVRVLLEGAPVGGVDAEQAGIVQGLLALGVDVRLLRGVEDFPARYATMHAKYAVRDGNALMVASENWNSGAYPPLGNGREGSRGWGLIVENASLAARFAEVFEADFGGRDAVAVPLRADVPAGALVPRVLDASTPFPMLRGEFLVTPVFAPDTALANATVLKLINEAQRTLDVQQLRAQPSWGGEPNPYLVALVAAAERGVRVRVLLDGTFGDEGNGRVVEDFTRIAQSRNLSLEARLSRGPGMIHNKGGIADGSSVLVSSLNWGEASARRNREAGVIVVSLPIASVYMRAFEEDWALASMQDPEDVTFKGTSAPGVATFLALAALAARAGRRTARRARAAGRGSGPPQPSGPFPLGKLRVRRPGAGIWDARFREPYENGRH